MPLVHRSSAPGLRPLRSTHGGRPAAARPRGGPSDKGGASLARAVLLVLFLAGACHCNGGDPCDTGSLRCHGTKVQICYPDDWMTIVDCATTGQVCSASEPACADAGESAPATVVGPASPLPARL